MRRRKQELDELIDELSEGEGRSSDNLTTIVGSEVREDAKVLGLESVDTTVGGNNG